MQAPADAVSRQYRIREESLTLAQQFAIPRANGSHQALFPGPLHRVDCDIGWSGREDLNLGPSIEPNDTEGLPRSRIYGVRVASGWRLGSTAACRPSPTC